MTINERIREVRQTLGLTQNKFSERIAISASYLAGMELGGKKVNERAIQLIVMEFNISEHWLRTGEGSMYDEASEINNAKIMSLFKSLNAKYQECALIQLNALAELHNSEKK